MNLKCCPRCNSTDIKKVKFNMWGGLIGAMIADDYSCNQCYNKFKGKDANHNPNLNKQTMPSEPQIIIPDTCPHCKNPNSKKIRLCEWCGNQII